MDRDISTLKTSTKIVFVVIFLVVMVVVGIGAFNLGKNFAEAENTEQKEKVDDKKEDEKEPTKTEEEPTKTESIEDEFVLDSDKRFIITTDSKYNTMQNDGGSHINIYYQVDLEEKVAYKLQDKYVGFKGYEYKGHLMNKKELSDEDVLEIEELVDKMIKDKDQVPEEETYKFYTLETKDYEEIKITNKDYQLKIVDLLE